MTAERTCLTIFAKAPEYGRVKTRLAADLGLAQALSIYLQLLHMTAEVARRWPGPVLVCATGDQEALADSALAPFSQISQVGGNLGDRLRAGLTSALSLPGCDKAIAIGTDCPGLNQVDLLSLSAQLDAADLALGPSGDGGYWALAVAHRAAVECACASDMPWSQPTLLHLTQERAKQRQLRLVLGPALDDVDTVDDWHHAVEAGLMPANIEQLPQ